GGDEHIAGDLAVIDDGDIFRLAGIDRRTGGRRDDAVFSIGDVDRGTAGQNGVGIVARRLDGAGVIDRGGRERFRPDKDRMAVFAGSRDRSAVGQFDRVAAETDTIGLVAINGDRAVVDDFRFGKAFDIHAPVLIAAFR